MRRRIRLLPLIFVCLAAFFFAGCVNVVGGGAGLSVITFLVVALGMGVVACSDDSAPSNNTGHGWDVGEDIQAEDADDSDTTETPDADSRDGYDPDAGRWEACCRDGVVDSCFCPANMACNYGMFQDCGDGTCAGGGHICEDVDAGEPDVGQPDVGEEPDAGEPDAGEPGSWQPCCSDGVVDSCFCPANMACNYGMFQDCGDGTCVLGGEVCPEDF